MAPCLHVITHMDMDMGSMDLDILLLVNLDMDMAPCQHNIAHMDMDMTPCLHICHFKIIIPY